jgi:uncharacterized sodium:solute symporter family permease YidK
VQSSGLYTANTTHHHYSRDVYSWLDGRTLTSGKSGFLDALKVSGKGKAECNSTGFKENGFNWKDQYNIWSGLIGGFFISLSYFGTDQTQVGRYLTAKSTSESRLGLLMNGLVKIPMQFLILMVGALVFTFYKYHHEPIFFNQTQVELLVNQNTRIH